MRKALEAREANKKVCRENTLSAKKIPITVRVGRAASTNSPFIPPLRGARCRTDKRLHSFLSVAGVPFILDEVWHVCVQNSKPLFTSCREGVPSRKLISRNVNKNLFSRVQTSF